MTLAELIDLELALERDAEQPIERLIERDRRIAREIEAPAREGEALYLAWLRAQGRPGGPSTGERVVRLRDGVAAALFGLGLLSGAATVGAWLAMSDRLPVNVTNFWPALVGSQLVLLGLWFVAVLPPRWLAPIPVLREFQTLLAALPRALPAAVGWVIGRFSESARQTLGVGLGRLRRLDWLYGRLRFWHSVVLTQTFALAFNLGALGAFVFLPYVDDPAFGWRSRLLEPAELHAAVESLARPWSHFYPEGTVTLAEIEATQYSSVAPRIGDPLDEAAADGRIWAAWWPFLFASLLAYGLLPRIVLLALASGLAARALARVRLDHAEFERLRVRLQGPFVDTRSPEAQEGPLEAPAGAEPQASDLSGKGCRVLRWAGVGLEADAFGAALERAFGARVLDVADVGGIDAAKDREALAALARGNGDAVLVVVPAWEPPVGDHLDFLRRAREVLPDGWPLVVLLAGAEAAAPDAARYWRRALARLADPYLFVQTLPAEASIA